MTNERLYDVEVENSRGGSASLSPPEPGIPFEDAVERVMSVERSDYDSRSFTIRRTR